MTDGVDNSCGRLAPNVLDDLVPISIAILKRACKGYAHATDIDSDFPLHNHHHYPSLPAPAFTQKGACTDGSAKEKVGFESSCRRSATRSGDE